MNGEHIPIKVIESEISGLNFAIGCDQGGAYYIRLRNALQEVLDWYHSPNYKKRLGICRKAKIVNDTAKWEEVPNEENNSFMNFPKSRCSNCGIEVFTAMANNNLNYCSNCGAFMRNDECVEGQDDKEPFDFLFADDLPDGETHIGHVGTLNL